MNTKLALKSKERELDGLKRPNSSLIKELASFKSLASIVPLVTFFKTMSYRIPWSRDLKYKLLE